MERRGDTCPRHVLGKYQSTRLRQHSAELGKAVRGLKNSGGNKQKRVFTQREEIHVGENWGVDSGLELLVRDNPRDTHPALPSRAFTASKHRNGSNVNINPQRPGSIICYVLSNETFSGSN